MSSNWEEMGDPMDAFSDFTTDIMKKGMKGKPRKDKQPSSPSNSTPPSFYDNLQTPGGGANTNNSPFKKHKLAHPAWRFYQALHTLDLDPKTLGLPSPDTIALQIVADDLWVNLLVTALSHRLTDTSKQVFGVLDPEEAAQHKVPEAVDSYFNPNVRDSIELLTLAGGSPQEISSTIGLPQEVIMSYQMMFFDLSIYSSRSELLAYVLLLEHSGRRTQAKEVLEGGITVAKVILGLKNVLVDELALTNNIIGHIYKKALDTMACTNSVEEEFASQGWFNLLLKTMQVTSKLKKEAEISSAVLPSIHVTLRPAEHNYTLDIDDIIAHNQALPEADKDLVELGLSLRESEL